MTISRCSMTSGPFTPPAGEMVSCGCVRNRVGLIKRLSCAAAGTRLMRVSLFLKAYLSKVFIETGLDVSGVELNVPEGAAGLYGDLPVARMDRAQKVFPVDID